MITAALYARVSSEKQAQENTVASQVEALKSRIIADSLPLLGLQLRNFRPDAKWSKLHGKIINNVVIFFLGIR